MRERRFSDFQSDAAGVLNFSFPHFLFPKRIHVSQSVILGGWNRR